MRDLGLLLLRIIVGGIFMAHGYPKVFGGPDKPVHPKARQYLGQGFEAAMGRGGMDQFGQSLAGMGFPMPKVMAWPGALAELVGGALLILGWLTRPAALALSVNMAIAIGHVHRKNGLMGQGGFELALALLGSLLALILGGPGAISIDGDE